jgi:outer membrane protein
MTMKKILAAVLVTVCFAFTAEAQRYAIVDTKYILDKIPDYKDAQKQLDAVSEVWQKEIDQKQADLDRMYRNFEAEQVMLSDELK